MHRNRKIALTLAASAVAVVFGWTAFANAAPSTTSTRLQLAEDQLANCQLLANNATSSSQRTRAQQCVTDQQRIIALLQGQSPSPSPSTTTTTPSPSPSGDTQAPSVPTGLAATVRANLDIMVTWNAATDNVGVVDYLFERGTTQLGVTDTPDWLDVGRSSGTTYNYRVRARDAAGNLSAYSATLSVTTPGASPSPSSTTPSPSTSPTGGTVLGCRNKLSSVGCNYPDGTNTGPTVGSILATMNGNQSFNQDNQTIQNVTINGCVEVHANNVTIKNSRIIANGCFYGVRNFGAGLILSDIELTCGGGNGTGVTSSDYTVIRANIHHCENGFNVGGNVTIRDTYFHDGVTANGAHTDGIQMNQGAANILVQHNTLITPTPGGTSAIIMWDEGNPQNSNVTIRDNFLIGGTYTLYCPRENASNIFITNNRFGEFQYGSSNSCISGHVTTFTGNFRDDGTPVTA